MLPYALVLATDVSKDGFSRSEAQKSLMRSFFARIPESALTSIHHGNFEGDACDGPETKKWKGVMCTDGVINSIDFSLLLAGQFTMACIPPDVQNVQINSCNQQWQLDTGVLPRELRRLGARHNMISGTVDLRRLPQHTVEVSLDWNEITAPVYLTELPRAFETLSLNNNLIQQKDVPYGNLPSSLQSVEIEDNSVKRLTKVAEDLHEYQDVGVYGSSMYSDDFIRSTIEQEEEWEYN